MEIENTIKSKLMTKPKLFLKFNTLMKEIGFEEVKEIDTIKIDTFFKELTFLYSSRRDSTKDLDSDVIKGLEELGGFSGRIITDIEIPTESIKFDVEIGGKTTTFGYYFKERNYFLCLYDFLGSSIIRKDVQNGIIPFFLNAIMDFHKINTFECVDVSEIGEKLMALTINAHWIKRIDENKGRIKRNLDYIREYDVKIKNYYEENMIIVKESSAVEEGLKGSIEKVKNMLIELKALKFLNGVEFGDKGLLLKYGDISITEKGKSIYIGNFDVVLGIDDVQIVNNKPVYKIRNKEDTDNLSQKYEHPHISSDSHSICFGSARGNVITKWRAELEFGKIARQILLYLKSYNPEDCYNKIYLWEKSEEINGKRYIIRE